MKRTILIVLPALVLPLAMACAGAQKTGDPASTTKGEATAPAGEAEGEVKAPAGAAAEAPLFASAEAFTADCDAALAEARALRTQLVAPQETRTIENTFRTLDRLWTTVDRAAGWASLIYNVHPEEAVREAARVCEEQVQKLVNDLNLDPEVYAAIAAVDVKDADALTRRFAEKTLRDFRRAGVDKDPETRARLAAMHEEMVRVGQAFGMNVRKDVRRIVLDDASALAGLPADYVAAHAPGEDGKIVITTDYPDFYPFQSYAERADLREALYREYLSRGYPDNEALLLKLLKLRHEYATTLGYSDWADYQAEDKMAREASAIDSFLSDIEKIVRPRMESDLKVLLARKQQDDPEAKQIHVWDRFYYVSKVKQATYDFDPRDVRPYFSYDKVEQGVLDVYAELFELEFVPLADAPVWNDEVRAFSMRSGGKEIARFFLDMHPREGKYKHAAMFSIQTGLKDGRIPMASLVCNFPDPEGGEALMEHNDVETFFHEFGHLLHHLLGSRSEWVALNGINVEWDFVEAPSQLLEEWAWDAGVLARFAKHKETGEPLPAELVARMRGADEFGKGVDVMRQIFYAAYSFELHRRDPSNLDLNAVTSELYEKYSPYPRMEGTHVYASFGHLVGYSSQYYSYQWALAIAKDLYSRFEKAGLMDAQTALEYRRAVLEAGGTEDAADMVKAFLGREHRLDAYRAWLQEGGAGE